MPIGDVYCGLRGLTKATFAQLDLQSSGMEFALEMIVKARLLGLRISEVPTTLSPDGRDRAPHLNTWRDGRRSLLLYLASMPSGFLLFPGLALMTLGFVLGARLAFGPLTVSGVHFDMHSLIYWGVAVLLGFQLAAYSVAIRFLMLTSKFLPPQMGYGWAAGLKLEQGLGLGLSFIVAGLAGVFWLLNVWRSDASGNLDPFVAMRIAIPSVHVRVPARPAQPVGRPRSLSTRVDTVDQPSTAGFSEAESPSPRLFLGRPAAHFRNIAGAPAARSLGAYGADLHLAAFE